jgi:hypothetical protein
LREGRLTEAGRFLPGLFFLVARVVT